MQIEYEVKIWAQNHILAEQLDCSYVIQSVDLFQ